MPIAAIRDTCKRKDGAGSSVRLLQPKNVWSIRTKLQMHGEKRDLAMFNLAIDSKLRGCDLVHIEVENIAPRGLTDGRASRPPTQNRTFRQGGRPIPYGQAQASRRLSI
jgi:hypothetical protein